MGNNLHKIDIGADLPQGKPAERVYTKEDVIAIIKADRQSLIEFIEQEMQYGMKSLFSKVPIQMKL